MPPPTADPFFRVEIWPKKALNPPFSARCSVAKCLKTKYRLDYLLHGMERGRRFDQLGPHASCNPFPRLNTATAFHVLSCHPWPCMLLNLRLNMDSSSAVRSQSF